MGCITQILFYAPAWSSEATNSSNLLLLCQLASQPPKATSQTMNVPWVCVCVRGALLPANLTVKKSLGNPELHLNNMAKPANNRQTPSTLRQKKKKQSPLEPTLRQIAPPPTTTTSQNHSPDPSKPRFKTTSQNHLFRKSLGAVILCFFEFCLQCVLAICWAALFAVVSVFVLSLISDHAYEIHHSIFSCDA